MDPSDNCLLRETLLLSKTQRPEGANDAKEHATQSGSKIISNGEEHVAPQFVRPHFFKKWPKQHQTTAVDQQLKSGQNNCGFHVQETESWPWVAPRTPRFLDEGTWSQLHRTWSNLEISPQNKVGSCNQVQQTETLVFTFYHWLNKKNSEKKATSSLAVWSLKTIFKRLRPDTSDLEGSFLCNCKAIPGEHQFSQASNDSGLIQLI